MLDLKMLSPVFVRGWLRVALVMALFGWATTVTVLLLKQKPETFLIAVDGVEPRLITEKNDQTLAKERLRMVARFLYLYNSYDPENVQERLDEASKLMSRALWLKQQDAVLGMLRKVKEEDITKKIVKLYGIREVSPFQFEAAMDVGYRSRIKEAVINVKVILRLEPQPMRNSMNQWGYVITDYVEEVQARS